MKKVKTRHALLMSVTSLMICVSMLLGATFAWFTDSVTSGVNKIVAGNLDVELYHKTTSTTVADPGDDVDSATKLFVDAADSNAILWEPGAMSYETFTVKNVGSLALKYKMALTQSGYNTVKGTTKSLLDVIKVAEIESPASFDRATLAAAFTNATPTLAQYITSGATAQTSNTLYPAGKGVSEKTFTLVLYWPSDTEGISAVKDNDYNLGRINGVNVTSSDNQPLWVNLGVTLVAGQFDYEIDVFDETYDESAPYAAVKVTNTLGATATKNAVADQPLTITSDDHTASVTVPAAANSGIGDDISYQMTVESVNAPANFTIGAGNDASFFDVDLKKLTNGANPEAATTQSGANYYVATLNVGANLDIQKVYHNSTEIGTDSNGNTTEYYGYDETSGILTLHVYSFSPFAVEYTAPLVAIGNTPYISVANAIAAVKDGETITMMKNGSGDITSDEDKTYTINFNGYAYEGDVSVTAGKVTLVNAKLTGTVSGSAVTVISGNYSTDVTDYLADGYLCIPNTEEDPSFWTVKSEADIASELALKAGATNVEKENTGAIGTMSDGVVYKWFSDGTVYIKDAENYNGKNGSDADDTTYYIMNGVVEVQGILDSAFLKSNVSKVKFTSNLDYAWKGFCGSSNAETNTKLTTVEFDGMTEIPARLLCNCVGLTSVTIPDTVTKIGEGAFRQSGLTSVTIPESVEVIEKEMVAYCPNITTVTFEGSPALNQYYVGRACVNLTDVYFNDPAITFTNNACITFSHTEGGIASGVILISN